MENKVIKKGLSVLLSLNMLMGGMFSDISLLAVKAETGVNVEKQVADVTENLTDSENKSVTDTVPVLSSVDTRDFSGGEQEEAYRVGIVAGEEISLRQILVESGFLRDSDVDAYLDSIDSVSVSDVDVFTLVEDRDDYVFVAKDHFDSEQVITLETDDSVSYITVTDRSKTPVGTVITDGGQTGSIAVTAAGGDRFSNSVIVYADFNWNGDAVNAVKANNVIYADYYSFNVNTSESVGSGYEVSAVFPNTVKGEGYRLFYVGDNHIEEIYGSVETTGDPNDPVAAGIRFHTNTLGSFVLACTKTYSYWLPQAPLSYSISSDEAVSFRDVAIQSGLVSKEEADLFLQHVKEITSDNPEVLKVELNENYECLIKPVVLFEEQTITVVMDDGQTAAISFVDKREKPEKPGTEGVLVSSKNTYEISVAYSGDANVPEGSELKLKEIPYYTNNGKELSNRAAEALDVDKKDIVSVTLVDVSIVKDEEAIEPEAPVDVKVQLNTETTEQYETQVISVGETTDVLNVTENGTGTAHEIIAETMDPVYAIVTVKLVKELVASDGKSYRVTVEYNKKSGIPENAELLVKELKEGDEGYEYYVAQSAAMLETAPEALSLARPFDITLINPDTGEEYQPNQDVKVSIELTDTDLREYTDVNIVHFGAETKVVDSELKGDTLQFNTDGFSVFVLIGTGTEEGTPRCTFTFYVWSSDAKNYITYPVTDDQGNPLNNQIIKNGKELIVPQLTSTNTEEFAGWYEGQIIDGKVQLKSEPYDFDNIRFNPNEDTSVDLYAVYKKYAHVVFHDQYDIATKSFPVAFTRRAELVTTGEGETAVTEATVKITDLSATYTKISNTNMAFLGWSETEVETPGVYEDEEHRSYVITTDSEGCIKVTGEKHLYPIYKEINWLTYYSAQSGKGADYVAPAQYFKGDNVPAPLPITTMEGHTFLGWWTGTLTTTTEGEVTIETVNYGSQVTNADGSLVTTLDDGGVYISDGKLYLHTDATLYAKWEDETTADYRIVVWKQNPSDPDNLENGSKTYEYMESTKLSDTIGATVSVPVEYTQRSYTGYTYARCDATTAVVADGSTVLNVYYDKNSGYTPSGSYKLTFKDSATKGASTDLPIVYENVNYGESIVEKIPTDPKRTGYKFTKWYLDPYCKVEANLSKMPDHDLTVYAGWETGWYIVTIDPNYGALYEEENGAGSGATWFWSSYEGEFIGEYRHATRNYVKSSSGTWYFVNHQGDGQGGDNGWPDRHTYYTQSPNKATEDTTFEYSPGTYTYAGWYEVHPDGTETPFEFGKHTDHNTTLRLHWKKTGIYYLSYAAGEGTLDDGNKKDLLINDEYADYANIVLTKSANAPEGYSFVGWKVRGSESTMIYKPGQTFILHADDAKRSGGKEIVYLDAVYTQVGTAGIAYDANGGTVAGSVSDFDFGYIYDAQGQPVRAQGTVNTQSGIAEVSGLTNNIKFKLSAGANFTKQGFELVGWSNKANYDPNDPDAELYSLGGDYGVDREEPITLYAVWKTNVTWHLNESNASWNGKGPGGSWGDPYVYDSSTNTHSLVVYLNNVVSEPPFVPVYTGTDNRVFQYWATRTGTGTPEDPFVYTKYNFNQSSIEGELHLYAYWSEPTTVTVHAVDASNPGLVEKTTADTGWEVDNITPRTAETILDKDTGCVTTPEGYAFAFAAVSESLNAISDKNAVTAIKYDSDKKGIYVKYASDSEYRELENEKDIYFVYYKENKLSIGYKSMEADGVLSDVTVSAPTQTNVDLGTYTMAEQLTDPLSLVSNYSYCAFAIGSADTHDDPKMNASNLSIITDAKGVGEGAPSLIIRNTWRGYEYSKDGNTWISCGYDPHLYVIYYTQHPTVVVFREETFGSSEAMDTAFTYNVKVEETTKKGTSEEETRTIYETGKDGKLPYTLRNGEQQSAVLFYSNDTASGEITTQTITITQTSNNNFTTSIQSDAGTVSNTSWTYESNGTTGTQTVTFNNSHTFQVEVHVAVVENDGTANGIIRRDNLRSTTEDNYSFDLPLGGSATILTELPWEDVFIGEKTNYTFGAIMYGSGAENDGDPVANTNLGVATISYERKDGNLYELVLKDASGQKMSELDGNQLYYLYYPMPKIRYVKENNDGTFTNITGCEMNPETGKIEPSDNITYDHATLTMNGKDVVQNENVEIPLSGLIISQSGNHFRMPPILDDGVYERYLSYDKIGVGAANVQSISELGDNVSSDLTVQLKVQDNTLKYSFDGVTWNDLPLSGVPTIYAIYTERGYDFQISKTVDMTSSGEDPIFADSSFEVTISSAAITRDSYEAEGAESDTIDATPASGTTPGTITLTVNDGTKIRIIGLGQGDYTVTESGNENYNLTAKIGPIVGGIIRPISVEENSKVSFELDYETRLDLTNSPKAICKIGNRKFYTLRSMVNYVDTEIVDKTALVEMLTDYVMPADDTVTFPSGFNLTITTAEEGFSGKGSLAVITRTENLANKILFTNNGNVTFNNIILEGNEVSASAPLIQSTGDLTIGAGAVIQNCFNNSTEEGTVFGGAINATAGNITVNGTIKNNKSVNGGAIYYSGNGTINLLGQGSIIDNIATTGNGGAIYMTGGSLNVSVMSSISNNNCAESGKGGAVYAESALITIDQKGSISNNKANEGGALYIESGTITVSETEGFDPPAVTQNTASTGNGGAIYIGSGSVTISGGTIANNIASLGFGGFIYSNDASVLISDTASIKTNNAKSGGAVYTSTGVVTISGGTVEMNSASDGNGGAVCAQEGSVVLSGLINLNSNTATSDGGAVYAASINVELDKTSSISENTATGNGGAICAQNGTILISSNGITETEVPPTIVSNTSGVNGGAIWLNSGSVTVAGGILSRNTAAGNGGAVYVESADFILTSEAGKSAPIVQGNKATNGNGGAVYAGSGLVTISGGTIGGTETNQGNEAGQNGGAFYAGSGAVTIGAVTLSGNKATQNGGAVYIDRGAVELTGTTMEVNTAANGAAIYINNGKATFTAGNYTNNTASNGGAVGMGSTNARLTFAGDIKINGNKLGTAESAPESNIYLDQDSDAVLIFAGLGTNASVGIYVPDSLTEQRDVPGARFANYTNDSNINLIKNDRYGFSVQKDTGSMNLFWGMKIKVKILYMESFSTTADFPPIPLADEDNYRYYTLDEYYPEFSDAAISELAAELYVKYGDNYKKEGSAMSKTAVYAGAFLDDANNYEDYLKELKWDSNNSKWTVTKRNGDTEDLYKSETEIHTLYIYYSEPAYISIENNTGMKLTISDMKVNNVPVINTQTVAGYGMVYAKNGNIRTALLPVTAEDLAFDDGDSISLLIPGGQGMNYTLDGSFETTEEKSVRLRRTGVAEVNLPVSASGVFEQITGTTLSDNGTYSIIFGDDKIICKVRWVPTTDVNPEDYSSFVDGIRENEKEYLFTSIHQALEFIKKYLTANKEGTVEMLTDYLLPSSDYVDIPQSFDITITTASTGNKKYKPVREGENRVTISRDTTNMNSMINSWKDADNNDRAATTLRINDLIFDGKSVKGTSDGGAVSSLWTNVYIDHTDFKNVYASNGGALLVMFRGKDKNNKATVPDTILQVANSDFDGCTSTTTEKSNRLGGGAIVTNAETMILDTCNFDTCTAIDQAGAVFHRVDGNYNSWARVDNCTFTNCRANAAGGLELNSKTITVSNTSFDHCMALERNGGGFNVWALNDTSGNPNKDCSVTVRNCTFNDCHVTGTNTSKTRYGGGFRSNAKETTIENSTFTNCSTTQHGGGACISNTNAVKCEINGSTFDGCTASGQGGGIYSKAFNTIIGEYKSELTDPNYVKGIGRYEINSENEVTRLTEVINNTSLIQGGGICQDRTGTLTLTNVFITDNTSTDNIKNGRGGGVFTSAVEVTIDGGSISNNTSRNEGGGLYSSATTFMNITGTTISGNASTNNAGGGVYYYPNTRTTPLNLTDCTMENNTAVNSNGGALWTDAGSVTIDHTKMENNTAKAGGGIFHDKNVENSFLILTDSTVSSCRATSGVGGGIRTNGWNVNLSGSTVSSNTSTGNGGGIWYDGSNDTNRNLMSLAINGSTVDGNTSGGNGGGIYTLVKSVTINSSYVDESGTAQAENVSISNNTAGLNGGGIYHSRDAEGSALTVTGTEDKKVQISNNKANSTGNNGFGGGVYTKVYNSSYTWAEISRNTSTNSGGGIYNEKDGNTYSLTVDHTTINGNTSSKQGGGIYTKTPLYFKNNSNITGNRLTGNNVEDAAGVFMLNNRTIYVGESGKTEADSSSIMENYTAAGSGSNLRLWWSNDRNNASSVYVYCDLNGKIYVANAAKVGTQFGSSEKSNPDGFVDDAPVFKADTSTLHGIIDRTDLDGKKIIWAGAPIAKITDGNGNLLYFKTTTDSQGHVIGTDAAIFDRLYSGAEDVESKIGAFNYLNSDNPVFYYADGTPYNRDDEGNIVYSVEMLVENFVSDSLIYVKGVEGRKVIFTTADTTDAKYPGEAKRATVKAGNITRTLLSPRGSLELKNIIIDGNNKVRAMWVEAKVNNSTVLLGQNSIIQNGKADNGAGVYIKNTSTTSPKTKLEINGGIIRYCESTDSNNGGGAVYLHSGTLDFSAGSITNCKAAGSGGGVFMNGGVFNMMGGTISDCSAKVGGGVLVPNNSSNPFNMGGGAIINNTATQTGGGIAVKGKNSRIMFSRVSKVNISGNKATKNGNTVTCNLELNMDTNDVIQTHNGGVLSGSYIGIYVDGAEGTDSVYDKHGVERKPFGRFADGDYTSNFYCFVNDRNGLKGGIIEEGDEDYQPNTIYWIKIFSLQVSTNIVAGDSSTLENDEKFLFKVNIRGNPTTPGQLRPEQIDSSTGDYGEMTFVSNKVDTTTATFMLSNNDNTITGVNLSEGLDYEIIEYLIVSGGSYENQHKRYAAMPMNGYDSATTNIEYNGTTYTVIKGNTYTSKIGENKTRTDVDPYTSAVPFTNLMPVCKITTSGGDNGDKLLYQRYKWNKTTNKPGEQEYYYAPAVYTELTGDNSAFKALEGKLYSSNSTYPPSHAISNNVKVKMLVSDYTMKAAVTLPITNNDGTITLTTAPSSDSLFPKQDPGTTSTVSRGFANSTMFTINNTGKLICETIILDGVKRTYTAAYNGGIMQVNSGGELTINNGATLQNSKTGAKGGAIYVASGGTVNMTAGTVNRNESVGDGAGIYLEQGSRLNLSGNPSFGKTVDNAGTITTAGNWKNETLNGQTNGGVIYYNPHQDIYIAGYASDSDDDTSAVSLHVTGEITSGKGNIWVWAAETPHYKSLRQFAVLDDASISEESLKAFRNARPDDITENPYKSEYEYLYGSKEGTTTGFVYWSGVRGEQRVVLRKTNNSTVPVPLSGAILNVYKGTSDSVYLENLESKENGVFWIGNLPYGIYILEETTYPTGYQKQSPSYFYLIITEDEIVSGDQSSNKDAVKTAAEQKAKELKDTRS